MEHIIKVYVLDLTLERLYDGIHAIEKQIEFPTEARHIIQRGANDRILSSDNADDLYSTEIEFRFDNRDIAEKCYKRLVDYLSKNNINISFSIRFSTIEHYFKGASESLFEIHNCRREYENVITPPIDISGRRGNIRVRTEDPITAIVKKEKISDKYWRVWFDNGYVNDYSAFDVDLMEIYKHYPKM